MGGEAEGSRNRFGESKSRPSEIQRGFGEISSRNTATPKEIFRRTMTRNQVADS